MIWEEMKESLIFTGLRETDAEAVMTIVGKAMIREGYAKDSFVQALLDREKEFPTGLDIRGIGVAIPHTDACHVKQEGIALAVLKDPVSFRLMGEENSKIAVRLIFVLTLLHPHSHVERLQNLLNIIQDAAVLEQLLYAEEKGEIIQIIRRKEDAL